MRPASSHVELSERGMAGMDDQRKGYSPGTLSNRYLPWSLTIISVNAPQRTPPVLDAAVLVL